MVRETRHLWVGNLPETVREDRIREHFKRYGRVQSVKILLSTACNSNFLLPSSTTDGFAKNADTADEHSGNIQSAGGSAISIANTSAVQTGSGGGTGCNSSATNCTTTNIATTASITTTIANSTSNFSGNSTVNNTSTANNNSSCSSSYSSNSSSHSTNSASNNNAGGAPSSIATNCTVGSVCATIAFMDIKSASKAHTAEHMFDNRVLTTEYYEPSSLPLSSVGEKSSTVGCSTIGNHHQPVGSNHVTVALVQTGQPPTICGSGTTGAGSLQSNSTVLPQQYSTPNSGTTPPTGPQSTTITVPPRFPTPNRGSSEDLSPGYTDRPTFYDRSSRSSESSEQYIRRPNNYHVSNDTRSRTRERPYRNGPYSAVTDRSNPTSLHRISSSSWYENSNPSPTSRSVYGNVASAVVSADNNSASRFDSNSERGSSFEIDCPPLSKLSTIRKKKSRSGSESPCGGESASSRSQSRSPSSCSSTNSGSTNSHASSSPVSGSDPSRVRNLQSTVSTPATSSSSSNPIVHSEDNRPLAICVRNLPLRSSDTSLKDGLFHEYKKHGKVTWVKVVGQNSERYALVCFKKPDDVDKALEVSHDKLFFGCKIEVAPYQGFDVEDNEFRPYEAELDEFHPKSTRTLFIGNLEKDITASELRKHFDCFGEIIEIDIKKQGLNAYAFCQYSDIISVVKAMRQMDGEHLGSNRIKLGFGKSMPTNCVWIDGVSDSVSEGYLTTQFSRFGPVSQAIIDRERKLGLVYFEQIQFAQTAVKEMRGVTLRGRKLQVDFASRECQDAFYEKLEKTGGSNPSSERGSSSSFDSTRDIATRGFDNANALPGSRFNRYDSSSGRSRASSFSRHSTLSNSGAASPINAGGSTPRGGAGGAGAGSRRGRYNAAGGEYHEGDVIDRRLKSYDEYSQGSGASHEDENYNYFRDRPESPLSRLAGTTEADVIPARRQSEKSPVVGCGDDDYSSSGGVGSGSGSVCSSSSKHHRVQSVVVSATEPPATVFQAPGDIRHLQKERHHLLEQLEECPSSGDELVSPKKRIKFNLSIDSISSVQTNLISDPNCDVIINHSNESSFMQHHRKSVEVRRLSECSNLKHCTNLNHSRRPSTDSNSRHSRDSHDHGANMFSPHATCKRRKTGISISEIEHHSSRGRGHQLHSHHSHEASCGESADGSRPGTPLCDERPENIIPSEPRRIPRERIPAEPLYLPLPKFAIQLYHQNRLFTSSHSSSFLTNHSSLSNALASPPPALLTRPTTHNNVLLSSLSHTSSIEQPPASPSRAFSHSSSSSDSETATSNSPSIEDRIKTLDEMFEKWSGGNANRNTSTFGDANHPPGSVGPGGNVNSTFASRHKFLDLDVHEVQPSDIVKSVLAKKSIFDDDLKRLENIGDKYEPRDFSNFSRSFLLSGLPTLSNSTAAVSTPTTVTPSPTTPTLPAKPVLLQPLQAFQAPPLNQVYQRLNTVSPSNSPQPMSPYNSPSPSPIITGAGVKLGSGLSSVAAKGLQYPFPSHPPLNVTQLPPHTPPVVQHMHNKSIAPPLQSHSSSYSLVDQKPMADGIIATPSTTIANASTINKPKTNISASSDGTQEKNNQSTNSRISNSMNVSSIPGSTNVGTVKPLIIHGKNDDNESSNAFGGKSPSSDGSQSRRGSQDFTNTNAKFFKSNSSKSSKADKGSSKHNSGNKSENDKKRKTESLDRRKNHDCDETEDSTMNTLSIDNPESTSNESTSKSEEDSSRIDRDHKKRLDNCEEQQQSSRIEQDRREREEQEHLHKEKERRDRARLEQQEREKQEQHRKEEEMRRREEQRERERKEKEEKERLFEEERIRREAEEIERRELEDRERREREEAERREREERDRREREERDRRECEERARREREEKERREREEIERREREERERKEREDKDRREREEIERREREERERKEREEMERREREIKERKDREEKERREREEYERIECDRERENLQRPEYERSDREKRILDDNLRHELDGKLSKKQLDRFDEKLSSSKSFHSSAENLFDQSDNLNKSDSMESNINNQYHLKHDDRHNKENAQKSRENTPFYSNDEHCIKRHEQNCSPTRANSKRRLSSQDSIDESKRFKFNSTENQRLLDRRDFKDPNRSTDVAKQHRHHGSNKTSGGKSIEEKLFVAEERIRKDSGFDERRKKGERHRSKDRNGKSHHKSRRPKDDKDAFGSNHILDNDLDMDKSYHDQDIPSSEDERKKKEFMKEKKRYETIGSLDDQQNSYRQYGSGDGNKQRDEKKSEKRSDRHGGTGERRGSNREDNISHVSMKSSSDRRSRLRKQNANSSDDSDSDEPKKHSIFDIPDDGPAYISMYDKVKARSCKNMQKQEEEKKIKAKFSQLKQSRAKREEKKRSNSWDEDSDIDLELGDLERRSQKHKDKNTAPNSSTDDDDHHSHHHHHHHSARSKDAYPSETESESKKPNYHRDRLNELCDGESSESSIQAHNYKPRRKITSRKNSRSTRIASDSSDDASAPSSNNRTTIKSEFNPNLPQTENITEEDDDSISKSKIKLEKYESIDSDASTKGSKPKFGSDSKLDFLKMEIKKEPKEEEFDMLTPDKMDALITKDDDQTSVSSFPDSKNSPSFNNLFSPETRKKHKKNKKKQRSFPSSDSQIPAESNMSGDNENLMKEKSMESVFDELKRESTGFHEKRRHVSRKEKKREKSRDESDRSREERYRLKKLKKHAKLFNDSALFDPQDTGFLSSAVKRGEKMEDIFGPISDDDSSHVSPTIMTPPPTKCDSFGNVDMANTSSSMPKIHSSHAPGESIGDTKSSSGKIGSGVYGEKEKHREKKKDKKRKERDKSSYHPHFLKEDDNSVDLDAAGRALEAQLMEDSDIKVENLSPPASGSISSSAKSMEQLSDVFRFSEGDENAECGIKKDVSESHRSKEKKKKKKRSKEERRHHHHHSSHSNVIMSPPSTPSFMDSSIISETTEPEKKEVVIIKPSLSLPCLLEDPPLPKQSTCSELPISRESTPLRSVLSTPSIPALTSSTPPASTVRKEPKNLIPGFGTDADGTIHESAVQSIAAEYIKPITKPDPIPEMPKLDDSDAQKADDKLDEKSRVVISQEETEDAVAALLGESFGTSADYSYEPDPIPEEESIPVPISDTVIPEEDAEEMRKAVQSLNNEELDIKPDTPQSDTDLQIDTDTEDQEDEVVVQLRFDNPPKTPDVDMSQIRRTCADLETTLKKEAEQSQRSNNEKERIETIKEISVPAVKTPEVTKVLSVVVASTKAATTTATDTVQKTTVTTNDPTTPKLQTVPIVSHIEVQKAQHVPAKPIIIENRILMAPVNASVVIQQPTQQQSPRPSGLITRPQLIYSTQPRLPIPISNQQPLRQQSPRPTGQYTISSAPTINIPEQKTYYQPFGVMVSPRHTTDTRLQSPRMPNVSQSQSQQPQQQFTSASAAAVKSSPPPSPNFIRQPGPRPMTPSHVVIQQRQLLSPPNQKPKVVTVTASSPSSNQSTNIVLSRLPVTPILTPINSKPIQVSNVTVAQPVLTQSIVTQPKTITLSNNIHAKLTVSPSTITDGGKESKDCVVSQPQQHISSQQGHTVLTYSTVRVTPVVTSISQQQPGQLMKQQVVESKVEKSVIEQRQIGQDSASNVITVAVQQPQQHHQQKTILQQQQPQQSPQSLQKSPLHQIQRQPIHTLRTVHLQPQQFLPQQMQSQSSVSQQQKQQLPLQSQQLKSPLPVQSQHQQLKQPSMQSQQPQQIHFQHLQNQKTQPSNQDIKTQFVQQTKSPLPVSSGHVQPQSYTTIQSVVRTESTELKFSASSPVQTSSEKPALPTAILISKPAEKLIDSSTTFLTHSQVNSPRITVQMQPSLQQQQQQQYQMSHGKPIQQPDKQSQHFASLQQPSHSEISKPIQPAAQPAIQIQHTQSSGQVFQSSPVHRQSPQIQQMQQSGQPPAQIQAPQMSTQPSLAPSHPPSDLNVQLQNQQGRLTVMRSIPPDSFQTQTFKLSLQQQQQPQQPTQYSNVQKPSIQPAALPQVQSQRSPQIQQSQKIQTAGQPVQYPMPIELPAQPAEIKPDTQIQPSVTMQIGGQPQLPQSPKITPAIKVPLQPEVKPDISPPPEAKPIDVADKKEPEKEIFESIPSAGTTGNVSESKEPAAQISSTSPKPEEQPEPKTKEADIEKPSLEAEPSKSETVIKIRVPKPVTLPSVDSKEYTEVISEKKSDSTADEDLDCKDDDAWSLKEIPNIDSVIKKVEAICSTEEEESADTQSQQLADVNAVTIPKEKEVNEPEVQSSETESTIDGDSPDKPRDEDEYEESLESRKSSGKRGRGVARGRKQAGSVVETPKLKLKDSPEPSPISGVQTRRGGGGGMKNQSKRGRGGGRATAAATAKSQPQTPATPTERKLRNQSSESDIYEFHEDSGEESTTNKVPVTASTSITKTGEGGRPRLILTIKGQSSVQPGSTVQPPSSPSATTTTTPASAPASTSPQPPIAASPTPPAPPAAPLATPPVPQQQKVSPQAKSPAPVQSQQVTAESKEDFSVPSSANLRKSRRLQERDGSRNTVDDIIEDVVKNLATSPKSSVASPSASTPAIPSSGMTPPRRSTRSSVQSIGKQMPTTTIDKPAAVNPAADVRKSPRAKRAKDRQSDNSADSSDEKSKTDDKPPVTVAEETTPKPVADIPSTVPSELADTSNIASLPQQNDTIKTVEVQSTPQKLEILKPLVEPPNPVKEDLANSEKPKTPVIPDKKPEPEVTKQDAVIDKPSTPIAVVVTPAAAKPTEVGAVVAKDPIKISETNEHLTLIDPVTGELTVMRQSTEGQYIPVPGVRAPPTATLTAAEIQIISRTSPVIQQQQSVLTRTPTPVSRVPSTPPTPTTVYTASPKPQPQQPPQPPQPSVVTSVASVSQPPPMPTTIVSQPPMQPLVQPPLQPAPVQIVTQRPAQSPQPVIVQQTIQTKPQQIRTHPLKAHMLNSQINKKVTHVSTISTIPSMDKPIVVQSPTKQTIISSTYSRPSSPISAAQFGHNLVVNVNPSAGPNAAPSPHSPRIQQSKLIQQVPQMQPTMHPQKPHQQLTMSPQHQQQQLPPQPHSHQSSTIATHIAGQPVVIHSNKLPPQHQPVGGYSSIVQAGKSGVHPPKHQSVPPQIQQTATTAIHQIPSGVPTKQQMMQQIHQVQMPSGSGSGQLQQIHHISSGPSQPQSATTITKIPGNVSVVTHPMGKINQMSHIHNVTRSSQQPPPSSVHMNPQNLPSGSAGVSQQHNVITTHTPVVTHQQQSVTVQQQQQQQLPAGKNVIHQQMPQASGKPIGLHQIPQIMTGAVASPPLKQSHLTSQQPIVTGASCSRVSVPPISPQGQARTHNLQPGLPVPAFEASLHGDISGFGTNRSQSPPPAHQQVSPITPGDGTFPAVPIRGVPRDHFIMYHQQFMRTQEVLGHGARIPYIPRSPLLPGNLDQKDVPDAEEPRDTSPPLELRRPSSVPRATTAVPHSLQSPQDRATDSPQVAQVYVHGSRIPHPHYPDVGTRYYDGSRSLPPVADPPPAHRSLGGAPPASTYSAPAIPQASPLHSHPHQKLIDREREIRERDKERSSIPGSKTKRHASMPSHGSLVPAMPTPAGRNVQIATPPHASQVPPQADSLLMLLQRYPVMWQGLLALKTDQAAVQMHFVFGNPQVASGSLPCNSDGSTPPLRIAQRMRLEQVQLEGVARKMQTDNEHCMLLALPCGRDHMDVLQQSNNLQTGFITYMQQKQAAGIVNIPAPGSEQAAYVVHIFPSCDFANENLARIAPDLLHRVADIAHLLIVIATV